MSEQDHRLYRLQLAFSMPEGENAPALQDRFSRLVRTAIQPLLDRLFTEYSEPTVRVGIKQLVLDLGKIPIPDLERILPERLEEVLRAELSQLLHPEGNKYNELQKTPIRPRLMEVLLTFLQHGIFPWWAGTDRYTITELLVKSIEREPIAFRDALFRVGQLERVRKRMAFRFSDKELKAIVRLIEPVEYPFIEGFADDLQNQHEKAPIVKASYADFRKSKWELILAHLLEKRGSVFNQMSFVQQVLSGLAARHGLEYRFLLGQMVQVVRESAVGQQINTSLAHIIIKLWEEETQKKVSKTGGALPDSVDRILNQLPSGKRAAASASLGYDERKEMPPFKKLGVKNWQELIRQLWSKDRSAVRALAERLTNASLREQSYLLHFPSDIALKLLEHYRPSLVGSIKALLLDLQMLAKQRLLPGTTSSQVQKIATGHLLLILRGDGNWYSAMDFLRILIAKLAAAGDYSTGQWLLELLSKKASLATSYSFQSDLLPYLEILASEHDLSLDPKAAEWGIQTLRDKASQDQLSIWEKAEALQSPEEFAALVRKSLTGDLPPALWAQLFEGLSPKSPWLNYALTNWKAEDLHLLFTKYNPLLKDFVSHWHQDWLMIWTLLVQSNGVRPLDERTAWQISWSIALQYRRRLTQLLLVRETIAGAARRSQQAVGNAFAFFEKTIRTQRLPLKLKQVLPDLLEGAIRSDPYLETSLAKPAGKSALLGQQINAVQTFFRTGKLAPGSSLELLREYLDNWIRLSPFSLRLWFLGSIRDDMVIERLITFFSEAANTRLLEILATPIGTFAQRMQGRVMKSIATLDRKLSAQAYWRVVWDAFAESPEPVSLSAFWEATIQKLEKLVGIPKVEVAHAMKVELSKQSGPENLLFLAVIELEELTAKQVEGASARLPADLIDWMGQQLAFKPDAKSGLPGVVLSWLKAQPTAKAAAVWQRLVKRKELLEVLTTWGDDRTLLGIMQELKPERVLHFVDIAVLLRAVQQERGEQVHRFLPPELSLLLLEGLLADRGSFSNQKNYLEQLLKAWARAHSIRFDELIGMLWPIVQQLGPVLRYDQSLELFREVVQSHLPPIVMEPLAKAQSLLEEVEKVKESPSPKGYDHQGVEKVKGELSEKPYKKLWDVEQKPLEFSEILLVQNAGLVLLWPYFNTLFERAGLMENHQFIDTIAQQKAIYLLEYLVRGEKVTEEYELPLNKVFCGWPIVEPLDIEFELEEGWAELCEGLLEAVIQYWSVLQDSSPQALRESFLLREGRLGLTEKGWHLKVEQKPYDVLLTQLPWGISVVNLSWLEQAMEVEWR